jgi:hypothetical protein
MSARDALDGTRLADPSATLLIVFIARYTIQGLLGARKKLRVIIATFGIRTKRVPHGAHLFELSFREFIHAGIVGIIHAVKSIPFEMSRANANVDETSSYLLIVNRILTATCKHKKLRKQLTTKTSNSMIQFTRARITTNGTAKSIIGLARSIVDRITRHATGTASVLK